MPTVLLIDDDASLLDALSLAFEDAGYEVLTAADGQRGLEVVKASKPNANSACLAVWLLGGWMVQRFATFFATALERMAR